MATQNVEISCINKTPRMDPHLRIASVGGVNGNGTRWKLPLDRAIAGTLNGTWQFFVTVGYSTVWVQVAYHEGHPYLKTQNDGLQPDNLLSLPECP